MKFFKLTSYTNSFWGWFVLTLVLNQIALIAIFYFVITKPVAQTMAQTIGAFIQLADKTYVDDHIHGHNNLQKIFTDFPTVTIDNKDVAIKEIPAFYVGLRVTGESLRKNLGEKFIVGYSDTSDPALLIRSSAEPDFTLRISFKGRAFGFGFFWFSIIILIIISIGASAWISARLVKPLQKLSTDAARLGKDKSFSRVEVDPNAPPEITKLSLTLNEMRASLDASIQERESLLAEVAHDVRTPLSRMRIAIELESANNSQFIEELKEDVIEMSTIIEQFIELARLNIEVQEPWSTNNINLLLDNIREKYHRSGMEVNLDLADNLPLIRFKPLALTRLLYNLINNAYRHGNGEVKIQTRDINGKVVLSVDNPITETDESLGLMRALQSQSSGNAAGVGLSIVRRFAQVHDAELSEIINADTRQYTLKFMHAL